MEKRLLPVNGLIGLVRRDGLNPLALAQAGFELVGLEVPCVTPEGNAAINVVLANPDAGHIAASESKCGSNVEVDQAKRYQVLDARTVVRSAFVTLRRRVDLTLEVIYVGLAEHMDRMLLSLCEAGVSFPMITVSRSQITLENRDAASELIRGALSTPITLTAPPASYIPFDHESDLETIRPHVRATLVAGLAQRAPMMSFTGITEHAAPHYVLYSTTTRSRLRRRVADAAREVANSDPSIFDFHPTVGNHEGYVKFLRTPEENDPRGRTQAYQGLARTARRTRRRPEIPGQGSLLDELDKADNNDESIASEQEGDDEL